MRKEIFFISIFNRCAFFKCSHFFSFPSHVQFFSSLSFFMKEATNYAEIFIINFSFSFFFSFLLPFFSCIIKWKLILYRCSWKNTARSQLEGKRYDGTLAWKIIEKGVDNDFKRICCRKVLELFDLHELYIISKWIFQYSLEIGLPFARFLPELSRIIFHLKLNLSKSISKLKIFLVPGDFDSESTIYFFQHWRQKNFFVAIIPSLDLFIVQYFY